MKSITMLKTTPGSPHGYDVKTYQANETYSVPDELARAFVDEMKVAKIASASDAAKADATEAAEPKPQGKRGSRK